MSADTDGLPPRLGIDRFHAPRQQTSITRQRYKDSPSQPICEGLAEGVAMAVATPTGKVLLTSLLMTP